MLNAKPLAVSKDTQSKSEEEWETEVSRAKWRASGKGYSAFWSAAITTMALFPFEWAKELSHLATVDFQSDPCPNGSLDDHIAMYQFFYAFGAFLLSYAALCGLSALIRYIAFSSIPKLPGKTARVVWRCVRWLGRTVTSRFAAR